VDDDNDRWWESASEPVLQYLVTICREIEADQAVPDDTRARAEALLERHPCYYGIARLGVGDGNLRHAARTLRGYQRQVLVEARSRLMASRREAYNDRDGQVIGWSGVEHYDAAADASGELWVRAWRARGTTNPETQALAGLHAAELALLAADEGHAGADGDRRAGLAREAPKER